MPKHTERSKVQREIDRARTVDLVNQGWTQQEIAAELGLHRSTIYYDLRVVLKRAVAESTKGAKRRIALRQQQLNRALKKSWEAFEQSKKDAVTLVNRDGADGASLTETVKGQCGDPAWMAKIIDIIEMHCKLEGLFTLKVAETDANGNDLDSETLAERRSRIFEALVKLGVVGAIDAVGAGDQCNAGDSSQLPANLGNLLPQ